MKLLAIFLVLFIAGGILFLTYRVKERLNSKKGETSLDFARQKFEEGKISRVDFEKIKHDFER